jgi:hexosaminidase
VDWIFLPPQVEFEISANGSNWEKWGIISNPLKEGDDSEQTVNYTVKNPSKDARFIRVTAQNFGVCPSGHPGERHPTWLFVDEIVVE